MRSFERLPPPQYWAENWTIWSNRYALNKDKNKSHTFQWATYEGEKVNQMALPLLIMQTQSHCSYCDAYPMKISDDTIDHFKPKGNPQFYHLAYEWGNLYYCCAACQKAKMEQFDDALLRPDEVGFSFSRYFIFNYTTHKIDPNPAASPEDQNRAVVTINILKLNDNAQCIARRHSIERYEKGNDLDDFAFRFVFE
jgi:uncharacterized protein (TIGR02646 family)